MYIYHNQYNLDPNFKHVPYFVQYAMPTGGAPWFITTHASLLVVRTCMGNCAKAPAYATPAPPTGPTPLPTVWFEWWSH